MTQRMHELVGEIVRLQTELDREIHKRRETLGFQMHAGLVAFEREAAAEHRRLRVGIIRFFAETSLATMLSAPLIYSLVIPFAIIDAWVSLYQAVCFRIYGIARVDRSAYIILDRRHLSYLNWIEALNCVFCGYGNGVAGYVREVASRTEQYWCPIKHAFRVPDPHQRYFEFLEFGDAKGYRERLAEFRRRLAETDAARKAA